MAADATAGLTTGQLAERTGMPAGTLRMWESRYGFPSPVRLPGGHHRYTPADAEMLLEVLRLRQQGFSLPAAIERVRASGAQQPTSIFAGLRAVRPELQPVRLAKPALLALSHALEDEYCARGASGLLIASFQRVRFYRQSERRWRELSRFADLACVLADFDKLRAPAHAPVEIPVTRRHPLNREWTLVIDAPRARACLAAWERPLVSEPEDRDRRFEVIWSFEPEVVRVARDIACERIVEFAPSVAERIPAVPDEPLAPSPAELRFATGLSQRIVGYLAGQP